MSHTAQNAAETARTQNAPRPRGKSTLTAGQMPSWVWLAVLAGARFRSWFWWGLIAGLVLGQVFLIWLWFEATFQINALCLYCMIVWAMMAPMLVLLTVRNLQHGVVPASPRLRQIAADWAWPVIALLYVAVIGSILLRFGLGIFQMG